MKIKFLLMIAIVTLFTCALAGTIYKHQVQKKVMKPFFSDDFKEEWKKVDSLEQKGLPKSALEIVNKIYLKAKSDKNTGQLVKAVIHRLKFTSYVEEDAFVLSLIDLKKEAHIAEAPAQQILHSMLAEMYWNYYQQNRYLFLNRTTTVDFVQDDIRTWDLQKVVEKVKEHYLLSLKNKEQLQEINIDVYDAVLAQGYNTRELRPTVYDFLANRVIDFFSQSEAGLTKPADEFLMKDEFYFSPVSEFVTKEITTTDTLNFKLYATKLTQELLLFRLNKNNAAALMDVDLKRLAFVYAQSIHLKKEVLYLNALLALEKKYENDAVSGNVIYQIAQLYYGYSQKYNPLQTDEHKWEAKRAYEICQTAIKKFPDSSGAEDCRSLQSNIKAKSIQLTLEKVNLPAEPFRGLITFKNVEKLYFRVIKTTGDEFRKIHDKDDRYYDSEYKKKIIEFYAAKKAVHQFEVKLPVDGDYQQHAVEVKIPELPLGDYIVLSGTNSSLSYEKEAVTYDFITVSAISYIQRTLPTGEIEFYVTHRKTGASLSGVKAQLWRQDYDYTNNRNKGKKDLSLTTDKNGYLKIPAPKDYRNFSIEFTSGQDRLFTGNDYSYNVDNSFYQYGREQEYTQVSTTSFYFLDRGIYRPGQTIYFKGIVIDTDGKKSNEIKKKYPVSVTLYDVNNQAVATQEFVSNEYGTYSGTFTAPSSGLNGQMRISDGYGNASFSVEDYKRPKFEVEIPALKGVFRLNDLVKVKGNAKAYSGANIDNAAVKYRVTRNAVFPYWWYCWKGYYPSSPDMEIANGSTKTDEKGEFEVTFNAIPDWSVPQDSKPYYNYTIYADATDLNGETRSTQSTITIGYTALKVSVGVTSSLEKEGKNEFNINTINLNGEFEPAKGTIQIYKLKDPERAFRTRLWSRPDTFLLSKEEFYRSFANDVYDEEDNSMRWGRETKVLDEKFDTEQNKTLKLADLKKWKPGKYVLEISSADKFGEKVKEVTYFTVIDKKDKDMPFTSATLFNVLKGSGEPSEKAEILIGSSNKISVLYELEKDNKIISSQWVSLNNEQKLFDILLKEEYLGNIGVHSTFISNGRLYSNSATITVPYTNKMLDVTFETFRDKLLPGEKEQWKIRIRGKQGEKVAAEMVATLYDASLDVFRANSFDFNILNYCYASLGWSSTSGFNKTEAEIYQDNWNDILGGYYKTYDVLNWFEYSSYYYRRYSNNRIMIRGASSLKKAKAGEEEEKMSDALMAAPAAELSEIVTVGYGTNKESASEKYADTIAVGGVKGEKKKEEPIKARTNFNETAFFYPHLQTDSNGDVLISFTIPEALTKWKMLGFAHTQDLKYGQVMNELVTQKELMVNSNAPRFFREGDQIVFTSKVTNLSDKDLDGTAKLELLDAITLKPLQQIILKEGADQSFQTKKGQSTVVSWSISIPEGISAITYRVTAKAGNHSDGEEMPVPVLTNRMLVTESLPLSVRGAQTKTFTLDKLANNSSTTLRNHKLTLEFTSNPAWYAIQSLPYLMEYPYECAEQTFSRFYANSIASHIANSSPKIKAVFDSWKNTDPKALLSNLEKNQELKSLLLEETPWVLDAQDESERKKRVALLFDLNKMSSELERALTKLKKMQKSNGGWPWFDGMRESGYITQHILTGLGHLDHLGVKKIREDESVFSMTKAAIGFMDEEIRREYEELKRSEKKKLIKLSDNHLGYSQIQYLYARSYFNDIPVPNNVREAFDYYKGQEIKYWMSWNKYMQGMIALGLSRLNEKAVPAAIVKSLREHALVSEELGMYWKSDYGFYWYEAPIETQALMIEVFDEVAKDQKAVDDMKVWLLKNKQTQNWSTTKATTEACYALLLRGTNWLASDAAAVEIKLGNKVIDPKKLEGVKTEAGTGYFKTSWSGSEIKPEMGKVTVTKTDAGVSWGSLYWQYFEQLDKITPHETPLKVKKQLFLQKNSATGPVITPVDEKTLLHPGDLIKVRIELRVDRDMEYVHMKDMRASALEPTNVISQYKYQGGLGYYESTRDAATNFFMDYLPKGTYVFEYPLRVTHEGNFSNGITSIQCMYAPEFGSHSEGVRVKVGK